MPTVQCPLEGCDYKTPDVEPVVAAALITTHVTVHHASNRSTPAARAEEIKRASVSSAGTIVEWQYFRSRWSDYVKVTRLEGTNKIIHLLECCDNQLHN